MIQTAFFWATHLRLSDFYQGRRSTEQQQQNIQRGKSQFLRNKHSDASSSHWNRLINNSNNRQLINWSEQVQKTYQSNYLADHSRTSNQTNHDWIQFGYSWIQRCVLLLLRPTRSRTLRGSAASLWTDMQAAEIASIRASEWRLDFVSRCYSIFISIY